MVKSRGDGPLIMNSDEEISVLDLDEEISVLDLDEEISVFAIWIRKFR